MRRLISCLAVLVLPLTAVAVATPAVADTATATSLLAQLGTATANHHGYERDLFGADWIDADGDGCNTRAEVLQAESTVPVTYSSGCTVATGQWTSPYDGATWTNASDVDIDHMVPLGEAWASGASAWTPDQRLAYANYLDFPDHLIAVTDEINQAKSDRDPAQWLPPLESDRCTYAVDWVAIKWAWSLTVDTDERTALNSLLAGTCGQTQVTITRQINPTPPPPPPAADTLATGATLAGGQQLTAANNYRLTMGTDGNAVVRNPSGAAVWVTSTQGHPGAAMTMQTDGNLVIRASNGTAIWANGARGAGAHLTIQTDGNLVERTGAGVAVWSTGTPKPPPPVQPGPSGATLPINGKMTSNQSLRTTNGYTFTVQSDGNLVQRAGSRVYRAFGGTGHPSPSLVLQTDGNLVARTAAGAAYWATNTAGRGVNRLVLGTDGNLVLYTASNTSPWSTGKDPGVTPPPPPPPPTNPPVQYHIHGGAFCSPVGAIGYSDTGSRYTCSVYPDGSHRWKPTP